MGARILPGMLSMLGEYFASIVFPVLKLLYRLPDEEWLGIGTLVSSLGSGGLPDAALLDVFVIASTTRLLTILTDFGAADVDWGTTPWRADHAAMMTVFADTSAAQPSYRMRLTPLGRHGIRNLLVRPSRRTPTTCGAAATRRQPTP